MTNKPRVYKITQLPNGFSKLAIAVRNALDDRDLFEIEGRLVFTDDIERYLEGAPCGSFCADEFLSFAALEKWLLDTVAAWLSSDCTPMIDCLNERINPA